jgi:hypothetical protein
MPFTRNPLDYPINRLIVSVGMALKGWMSLIPAKHDPRDQQQFEQRFIDHFKLDQQIEDGLIRGYYFHWDRHGRLKRIHLVPSDKVRRTPGIARLTKLFLRR